MSTGRQPIRRRRNGQRRAGQRRAGQRRIGPGGSIPGLAGIAMVLTVVAVLGGVGPSGVGPRSAGAAGVVGAEGDLMPFGPSDDPVGGQTVRVLEEPALSATTDGSGHWRVEGIPAGSTATFVVDTGGRYPIQTATFVLGDTDLTHVTFQSPSLAMVEVLRNLLGTALHPDRCQIASTVTRRGYSLYGGAPDGTHGEPGATVTISPAPAGGEGPIYFNGSRFDLIWPDRSLTATTADGGVLFTNIPPGTYTLRAHKPGAVISEVTVGCRAGVLTNASPPWGLQVLSGGLDLDETVPFPPASSTTTPPASTPSSSGASPERASATDPSSPANASPIVAPVVAATPRFTG